MVSKSQSQKQRSAIMTPLLLIGSFVSLTELIAGVTIIQTTGFVQIILVCFVVLFPLLIASAFFWILAYRNYVLFPPSEFGPNVDVSKYVNAMVHPKSSKDEYEDLAHSLFGILDAVKQEMPDVIRSLPEPRPKTITAQADVSLCHKPTDKYSMKMRNHVQRITAGSVSRKDAAMKYRFLADEYSRLSTQKAIGELSITEKNVYAKIRPDGTIHSKVDLDRKNEELDGKWKIDHNEFLFVQIIDMVHGQLVIVFFQGDLVPISERKTKQLANGFNSLGNAVSKSALVISDEGDIYGTVLDITSSIE